MSDATSTPTDALPNDWQFKSVRDIGDIRTGPFGTLLKAAEYSGFDGVPLISVGEIGPGYFKVTERTPKVPDQVVRRLPQYVLRTGDIVFGRKGAVDRSALVSKSQDGWFLGSDGISVRPSDKCHAPYLACQFQRPVVQQWLLQNASGTTMPSLNQDVLSRVIIPYAPLPEQRAIAAALSDVDTLLAKLDALIAKKRDLKDAAMQQLLTGQTRLPGFCEDWNSHSLGQLADPRQQWSLTGGPFGSNLKSSDYTTDGVRIIQLQNIGDGQFHDDYAIYTSPGKAGELESCNIYPGEIIMSKMGDPVARACLVPAGDDRYLMCSDGIRLAVDERRFDTKFVFYQINAPQFRARADNAGTGSTRKRIGLAQLRNLQLACPTLAEQAAIAAVLSDMDGEIAAIEVRRGKTGALKQGMMQALLTGRIRLI